VEGVGDAEGEQGMQEVSMIDDMQEVSMADEMQEVSMAEEPAVAEEITLETTDTVGEAQEESLENQQDLADLGGAAQDTTAGAVQDLIVLEDGEDEEDDLDFDLAEEGEICAEQDVYGEEIADMAEEAEETPTPVTRSRSLTLQQNAVKTTGQAMMRPQAQAGTSSMLGRTVPQSNVAPVEYEVEDGEEDDEDEAT